VWGLNVDLVLVSRGEKKQPEVQRLAHPPLTLFQGRGFLVGILVSCGGSSSRISRQKSRPSKGKKRGTHKSTTKPGPPVLISSLLAALTLAFLTWGMIGNHAYRRPTGIGFEYLGEVIMILLLPGMFAGVMVSGNIHVANTWIVSLGNFVFYFGVVYLILAVRENRRARHHSAMPTIPTSGSSMMPK